MQWLHFSAATCKTGAKLLMYGVTRPHWSTHGSGKCFIAGLIKEEIRSCWYDGRCWGGVCGLCPLTTWLQAGGGLFLQRLADLPECWVSSPTLLSAWRLSKFQFLNSRNPGLYDHLCPDIRWRMIRRYRADGQLPGSARLAGGAAFPTTPGFLLWTILVVVWICPACSHGQLLWAQVQCMLWPGRCFSHMEVIGISLERQ